MKVSIIIPNFNGEKILPKNLPGVLNAIKSSDFDSEIIISDDNSSDASVEIIKKFIEDNKESKVKIKLLEASVNKGFSSNVNRGAREAVGDILVLLNTDVIPSKNFLDPLMIHFKDDDVFAVGCMDESVEDGKIVLRGRGKGVWRRGFLNHSAASIDGFDTLWVSGGSGAFRKSIWDKLGGLDTLYDPFYWEDIDLSYRANKSGFRTIFEKNSVVRHEHEKGVIKTKYKPTWVKRTVYRNQFIFSWKNSDFNTLISSIFWLPYHLINGAVTGDSSLIFGFFLALKRLPKILSSRRKAKKHFIKSDEEVTANIK